MTGCLYEIVNIKSVEGRRYIGGTINPKNRWKRHRGDLRAGRHDCSSLQRAWAEYGEAAFRFNIIADGIALEELSRAEANALMAAGPVYNLTLAEMAASGQPVFIVSAATRAKLSAQRKGVPKSAEHRAKIAASHVGLSAPYVGLKRTAEHCANMSKAAKGKPKSAKHVAAMLISRFKGRDPNWYAGATISERAIADQLREQIIAETDSARRDYLKETRRKLISKCARRAKHGQSARIR